MASSGFLFPEWVDRARPLAGALAALLPLYLIGLLYYGMWPTTTNVGYSPVQPIGYSHAQHAGELAIDCRYCHNTVERAAMAAVPPMATCMNCHALLTPDSPEMASFQQSLASGEPVRWVRVHDLPDFVYFDHSAHVSRGVGCVSCHGRVDRMQRVYQAEPLSMGWCLDCHRNPGPHLRPREQITRLDWIPGEDPRVLQQRLLKEYNITPGKALTDCSTCHR